MNVEDKVTPTSIRMRQSNQNELRELIEQSDCDTQDQFMGVLIQTYKASQLANSAGVKADIEEFNNLTSRMYKLYVNSIERNETNISNIKADLQNQSVKSEEKVKEVESRLTKEIEKSKNLTESLESVQKLYQELAQEYKKIHNISEKSDKLIAKLEEETKELSQLRIKNTNMSVQLGGFEDEVKKLKEQEKELIKQIDERKLDNKKIIESIEDLKSKHNEELESLKKTLDFEKQQEILKLRQEHQEQLQMKDNGLINMKNEHLTEKQNYQDEINSLLKENLILKDSIEKKKITHD